MGKTILAIGGHIGDMELTAGGLMASNAIDGGTNITLLKFLLSILLNVP